MVGTPLAGRAAGSSAASSSQRCYFTMPLFPLNAFYLNFKASPALFFFFLLHFCFAWLCLWSRIGPGIKKHGYWKRKLPAFFSRSLSLSIFFPLLLTARFLHFTSRSPTAERPLLLLSRPCRFSALDGRKKPISLVRQSRASPFLPVFAVAASEMYLHIHPPLCDTANKARHERFVFVCVFLKGKRGSNSLVWLRVSSRSHCER